MNQPEWQGLVILAAALAFVLAATVIQRLLGWAAAQRGAAATAGAADARAPEPVRPPDDLDAPWGEGSRDQHRAAAHRASRPAERTPRSGASRRARQLLRTPGGLKAAILACEILGPPVGSSGLPRPR